MRSTPRISIFGDTQLPGSISDLEGAVFVRIEGMGGVTGSGCGPAGWNLDIEFDSPNAFTAILDAVLQSLHENRIDPESVSVAVRGRRRKLLDCL